MKLLIACGTGMMCSTIIRMKVENLLKDTNYQVEIEQCRFDEIKAHLNDVDLLILAAEIETHYDVPTIIAYNYLSENNEKAVDEQILNFLKHHI
ncbi:MAG: hypothetical protein J6D29_06700 [Solobacterium sp.]|nr:hypothetical protein [Solobacterium sp.]